MGKANPKAKPRAPQLNPFDRRSDETIRAYQAFVIYRDLGEGRTLEKTLEALNAERPDHPRPAGYVRQLATWSSRYEWVSRVRAWDDAEARRKVIGDDPLDAALGLTLKQKLFAEAYVTNGGNGVRAAQAAGYNSTSYNVLAAIASENLRKPEIRAYIDQLTRDLSMGASEVLYRLTEIAHGDMREFIGKSYRELKAHNQGHLIKKIETRIEVEKGESDEDAPRLFEVTKIELYSKADALQMLGKFHKLFVDRVQVEDPRKEVIEAIQRGELTYEAVLEAFKDESLAAELFRSAGVEV